MFARGIGCRRIQNTTKPLIITDRVAQRIGKLALGTWIA